MFGIGFSEFLIIAIIAILFLGPDKMPEAIVKIVKFFKQISRSLNEAKSSIEQELNIEELKNDAKKYREMLEKNTKELKKTLSFDELESGLNETNLAIKDIKDEAIKLQDDLKSQINIENKPAKIEDK